MIYMINILKMELLNKAIEDKYGWEYYLQAWQVLLEEYKKKIGRDYDSSFQFLLEWLKKWKYNQIIAQKYTIDQLAKAVSWIKPERDKQYGYNAVKMFTERYMLENELPQEMFLFNALVLANWDLELAKKIYDYTSLRKISLPTPMLANARTPNNQLASCYIIEMDDNIESIFWTIGDVALMSKWGGGVGVYVGNVRAKGSEIRWHKMSITDIQTEIDLCKSVLLNQPEDMPAEIIADYQKRYRRLKTLLEVKQNQLIKS